MKEYWQKFKMEIMEVTIPNRLITSASGVPFIMANNLVDGTVDIDNCKFIRKEQADRLRVGFAKPGDVLLSHKGTVGRGCHCP